MMNNIDKTYLQFTESRDLFKGTSFKMNEWTPDTFYANDTNIIDFISYKGAFLYCIKTHWSSEDNKPILLYSPGTNIPTGIVPNQYWSFIFGGTNVHVDGIETLVPKFKIEDGCLHVSYNTTDWTNLGTIVGEKGAPGETGAPGDINNIKFNINNDGHLICRVGQTSSDLGKVVGDPGQKGDKGDSAQIPETRNITHVDVEYGTSDSRNVEPITWSTELNNVWNNAFIWSRYVFYYSDNTIEYSHASCITGNAGINGLGIQKISEEYYLSTSNVECVNGTWSPSRPSISQGYYLWVKIKFVLDNGTIVYTDAFCVTGVAGSNGTSYTFALSNSHHEIVGKELSTTMISCYAQTISTQFTVCKNNNNLTDQEYTIWVKNPDGTKWSKIDYPKNGWAFTFDEGTQKSIGTLIYDFKCIIDGVEIIKSLQVTFKPDEVKYVLHLTPQILCVDSDRTNKWPTFEDPASKVSIEKISYSKFGQTAEFIPHNDWKDQELVVEIYCPNKNEWAMLTGNIFGLDARAFGDILGDYDSIPLRLTKGDEIRDEQALSIMVAEYNPYTQINIKIYSNESSWENFFINPDTYKNEYKWCTKVRFNSEGYVSFGYENNWTDYGKEIKTHSEYLSQGAKYVSFANFFGTIETDESGTIIYTPYDKDGVQSKFQWSEFTPLDVSYLEEAFGYIDDSTVTLSKMVVVTNEQSQVVAGISNNSTITTDNGDIKPPMFFAGANGLHDANNAKFRVSKSGDVIANSFTAIDAKIKTSQNLDDTLISNNTFIPENAYSNNIYIIESDDPHHILDTEEKITIEGSEIFKKKLILKKSIHYFDKSCWIFHNNCGSPIELCYDSVGIDNITVMPTSIVLPRDTTISLLSMPIYDLITEKDMTNNPVQIYGVVDMGFRKIVLKNE